MKVYKHGTTDPFKEYKVKCEDCKCEFSYNLRDLTGGITYDSILTKLMPYRFIRCPECFAIYLHQEENEKDNDVGLTYDGGDEDSKPIEEDEG